MKDWKVLLGPMRLPFVILAPCCVLLGLGTAYWETGGHINWLYFALTLIGGAAAHISVNAFNEYFDFKTGLDSQTRRTPFSGGSGTLQTHPELQRGALAIAWISFAITALVGIFFVFVWGWQFIPFGIFGLFLLYSYTIWLAYNPILCLIAPGTRLRPHDGHGHALCADRQIFAGCLSRVAGTVLPRQRLAAAQSISRCRSGSIHWPASFPDHDRTQIQRIHLHRLFACDLRGDCARRSLRILAQVRSARIADVGACSTSHSRRAGKLREYSRADSFDGTKRADQSAYAGFGCGRLADSLASAWSLIE